MQIKVPIISAIRSLVRDRSQAAGIVVTLALGIGGLVTMAEIVDSIMFRPLPFADGDRLVVIHNKYGRGTEAVSTASSPPDYQDRVELSRTVESLAAWAPRNVSLTGRGEPARLLAGRATASLADTLGVRPRYGRWFTKQEDEGQARVAVISAGFATSNFGDRDALGSELILNGVAHEVIGVMDPAFDFAPVDADLWIPLGLTQADVSNEERGNEYIFVVGRIGRGFTIHHVRAEMDSIAEGVAERDPSRADFLAAAGWGAIVKSVREELYSDLSRTSMTLLGFGLVMLVMSLVNATQLAVVRTIRRREALAIREAVGATRGHLVAQLVCEAVILGLAAAAVGLGIARFVFVVVRQSAPVEALRNLPLSVDARLVAFALACAIGCGLLASLGPLLASKGALAAVTTSGRAASQSRSAARFRGLVTVAEVALSVALITGGIAVWQHVSRLLDVAPGFRSEAISTMRLSLPSDEYDVTGRREFADALLARLRQAPGVESAELVTSIPMSGESWTASFHVEDRPDLEVAGANIRISSPGYFDLMGIPLRSGEVFGSATDPGAMQVTIDEETAKRYWPDTNPVGRRITFSDEDDDEIVWWTISGVVGSVRDESLSQGVEPHVYLPMAQRPPRSFFVAARVSGTGRDAEGMFRSVVHELDPALPVWNVMTQEQRVQRSLDLQRFRLSVLWAFGAAGLALAALGVYGVVAFAFSLAKADHAVRMALGATRADLVRVGLGNIVRPLLSGLLIGVAVFALVASVADTTLEGMDARSGSAWLIASVIVAALVMIAALVPALRLSKIDPVDALRSV